MPIYEIIDFSISPITEASFQDLKVNELGGL